MTTERQQNLLLDHYEGLLQTLIPSAQSARQSTATAPLVATVEHLHWMIGEVRGYIQHGNGLKATRWLGYIEGSLVQLGLITLEAIQLLDVESSFLGT